MSPSWTRADCWSNEILLVTFQVENGNYVLVGSIGSRKTSQIIRRGCQLAHEHKRVLILQPTKELIAKTVAGELNRRPGVPQYHVFHQDTVAGSSVASAMTRFFNAAEAAGQIVFATHQVFPYIPHIANKADWHVLVDEELQILRHNRHQISQTHALITDHIELVPHDSIYSRVLVRDLELLAHARNKDGDELLERIRDTGRLLCSKQWDTYVNTEQYEKLRKGSVKRLAFHSSFELATPCWFRISVHGGGQFRRHGGLPALEPGC